MAKVDVVEWFKRWHKPLKTWFSKNHANGDSEDLTQELFIRLIRFSDTLDVENPEPYVFTMAYNIMAEYRTRCRVAKPHDAEWLDDLVSNEPSLEEEKEQEELVSLVNDLINKLPERQCKVIKLFIYEKLTYKEIGHELGITQRTVLREIVRAYTQLRAWLGPILSEVIDRECADNGTGNIDDDCADGESAAGATGTAVRVRAKSA